MCAHTHLHADAWTVLDNMSKIITRFVAHFKQPPVAPQIMVNLGLRCVWGRGGGCQRQVLNSLMQICINSFCMKDGHTHAHPYTCMCTRACTQAYVHTDMHTHTHIYTHMLVCTHTSTTHTLLKLSIMTEWLDSDSCHTQTILIIMYKIVATLGTIPTYPHFSNFNNKKHAHFQWKQLFQATKTN